MKKLEKKMTEENFILEETRKIMGISKFFLEPRDKVSAKIYEYSNLIDVINKTDKEIL